MTIGGEDVFLYEPLALEYVAAGVSKEHDVRILDLRIEPGYQAVLEAFRPDIVGMTAYTVHVNTVRSLLEQTKRWNRRALTIVGGHHATVRPEDFASPFTDAIVVGEGVVPFRQFVNKFEAGDNFEGIPGVAVFKGGQLVTTPCQPENDLDAFPFPDRSLTSKYRRHYYSEWMKPLASMRTSKGCPHRCTFCAQWKLAGGRYLKRRPEAVVEELAGVEEKFVFFADDESLVDVERMRTLARQIKGAGIRKQYFLYGRSDTITRHPDLLEMWREIGLSRVFVGLEFFRDEDLRYVRKGATAVDNDRAVRVLHDLDIDVYASFILRPEFGREDFAALKEYCRKLRLNFASFAVLTPLPSTDLYAEVQDQLITRDYDYFDFIHTLLPTKLPLRDFYQEYHQLYSTAIPRTRRLSLLKDFRLKDIAPLLVKSSRFSSRLRKAYRDYELKS